MTPSALRRVGATILLLCSVMAGACTHIPPEKKATEKPGTMSTDTYKLSQAGEYPDLTAEEAGRRVLNLVDGLESMDELPLERVIERTGLPLTYAPAGNLHAFAVELAGNRGFYNVIYRDKNGRRFVEIRYDGPEESEHSDVFPCVLGATAVAERLKALGYIMNTDIDEIGRTLEHVFTRGRLSVRIVPSSYSMSSPLGTDTCVAVLTIQSKD
ncbi:hypothetical protein [Lysobacter sp. Hz 25]|uniref:hypothetical protein n=1 Tax=Lysobacter sp. Hz 25 TaxID=3383698 RepID=UPI0038D374B5